MENKIYPVSKGSLTKAPIFDRRANYKNWMAILDIEDLAVRSFSRRFLKTPSSQKTFLYYISTLRVGEVVEFAAEKEGRNRWYGIVRGFDADNLELEPCASFKEALDQAVFFKRNQDIQKDGPIKVLNLTYYWASKELRKVGVVEPSKEDKEVIRGMLMAQKNKEEGQLDYKGLKKRVDAVVEVANKHNIPFALIGGLPFIASMLEECLRRANIVPLYSYGDKEGKGGSYTHNRFVCTSLKDEQRLETVNAALSQGHSG